MAETIKTIVDATWPKLKARAVEMGIAAPATPTTWARVHSEIAGFADRAAAKVKALTPAAEPPVVAPPPPAPSPPATAGVVGVDFAAISSAGAGETVFLKPGYHTGRLQGLKPAAPITIRSADPARPAVIADDFDMTDCARIVLDGVNFEHRGVIQDIYFGRRLNACQAVSILRADMKGYQRRYGQFGLMGCTDILIDQCEIHDGKTGIGHDKSARVVISRNFFHDSQTDAIAGNSSGVTVDANYFTNFYPVAEDHADCVQFYEDWSTTPSSVARDIRVTNNLYLRGAGAAVDFIFMRVTDGHPSKMENVVVADNACVGPGYHGVTIIGGRNVLVERNTVRPAADLGAFIWIGGSDIVVQRDNVAGAMIYGIGDTPNAEPTNSNTGVVRSGNAIDTSIPTPAQIAALKDAWKARNPNTRTD